MNIMGMSYKREDSESQLAADKKTMGWKIEQRRENRIRQLQCARAHETICSM